MPAAQSAQALRPTAEPYVPAVQFTHCVLDDALLKDPYVPIEHNAHTEEPEIDVYEPATHPVHDEMPFDGAYVPAEHHTQAVPDAEE